ncbi:hypothetical protein BKA82DRAFT_9128 [Pisolithus tinctorius]|nr:hypothetical protein BKA82DRAFT_9128 [Pisolithus tinctorius]
MDTQPFVLAPVHHRCTTIGSMPEDIMVRIFFEVAVQSGDSTLRAASHVCQHWRAILLQAPLVWREALNFTVGHRWLQAILGRTSTLPLRVHIRSEDVMHDTGELILTNLPTIANHFWRIKEFHLEAPYPYSYEFFRHVTPGYQGVPLLQSLSLCSSDLDDTLDGSELPLQPLMIAGPLLQRLVLDNCFLRWDVLESTLDLSRNLSVIHILNTGDSDIPCSLPLSKFLAILALLSSLRELRLCNAFMPGAEEVNSDKITLAELRTLQFESGSMTSCSRFLNAVQTPALVELDVGNILESYPAEFPEFMTGIKNVAPSGPYDVLTTLYQHGRLWIMLTSVTRDDFCHVQIDCLSTHHDFLSPIYITLADMPSLHDIEQLEISLTPEVHVMVTSTMWSYLFRRLNGVFFLGLGKFPPRSVLQCLYDNAQDAAQAQRQGQDIEIYLPSLENIFIAPFSGLHSLVNTICVLRSAVGAPTDTYLTSGVDNRGLENLCERIGAWLHGRTNASLQSLLPSLEMVFEDVGEDDG